MNEAAYLRAALGSFRTGHQEPARILGQELEEYSFGHEMFMRQAQNVFILSREDLDAVDPNGEKILQHLFWGVYACCHPYDELREALRRQDLQKIGRRWRARAKAEGIDEASEIRRFKCYLLAGRYLAPFEPVQQRGRRPYSPGAPWLLLLLKTLLGPLNFSLDAALNIPYAHAQYLYLAYWESQGTVRLLSDEDEKKIHKAAAAEGLQVMRFSPAAPCPSPQTGEEQAEGPSGLAPTTIGEETT